MSRQGPEILVGLSPSSVVRPVDVSQKLSKIALLLRRSIRKLASLILLSINIFPDVPLGRYSGFRYKKNMCKYQHGLMFDLASDHGRCKPSTTVVSQPVLSAVVNECDARNLLFTVVVRCVEDAKVEQEAGQLLFVVRNSCCTYFITAFAVCN